MSRPRSHRANPTPDVASPNRRMIRIPFLDSQQPEAFPPVNEALSEPDGLLAAGGDLSPARLLAAYRLGIFPWYSRGQPILWWSPDPRTVFDTAHMHVPRRLARFLRTCDWTLAADTAFETVVRACAAPRAGQRGTWLDPDMRKAYQRLHELGHAHSIEAWDGDALAGGIYGVSIGRMFFGESMFAHETDASKVALVHLVDKLRALGVPVVDCQQETAHLAALGARPIPRQRFAAHLAELIHSVEPPPGWRNPAS